MLFLRSVLSQGRASCAASALVSVKSKTGVPRILVDVTVLVLPLLHESQPLAQTGQNKDKKCEGCKISRSAALHDDLRGVVSVRIIGGNHGLCKWGVNVNKKKEECLGNKPCRIDGAEIVIDVGPKQNAVHWRSTGSGVIAFGSEEEMNRWKAQGGQFPRIVKAGPFRVNPGSKVYIYVGPKDGACGRSVSTDVSVATKTGKDGKAVYHSIDIPCEECRELRDESPVPQPL